MEQHSSISEDDIESEFIHRGMALAWSKSDDNNNTADDLDDGNINELSDEMNRNGDDNARIIHSSSDIDEDTQYLSHGSSSMSRLNTRVEIDTESSEDEDRVSNKIITMNDYTTVSNEFYSTSKRRYQSTQKSFSRKSRRVSRCSSPTHFRFTPSTMLRYGPPFKNDMPDRMRVNELLLAVSDAYCQSDNASIDLSAEGDTVMIGSQYATSQYHTYDALISPLRKPSVFDYWSPKEIALFECGICKYGKEFYQIHKHLLPSKTTNQIVEFYYVWKMSNHYVIWKKSNKNNDNDVEASKPVSSSQ